MATDFIAGHWTVVVTPHTGDAPGDLGTPYNIGSTENGFQVITRPSLLPVRTDEYGNSIIDFIFSGVEEFGILIRTLHHDDTIRQYAMRGLDKDLDGNELGTVTHAPGSIIQSLTVQPTFDVALFPTSGALYDPTGVQTNAYRFRYAYPAQQMDLFFSSTRLLSVPFGFVVLPDIITTPGTQKFFEMTACEAVADLQNPITWTWST